jgi:hypothetical protein
MQSVKYSIKGSAALQDNCTKAQRQNGTTVQGHKDSPHGVKTSRQLPQTTHRLMNVVRKSRESGA